MFKAAHAGGLSPALHECKCAACMTYTYTADVLLFSSVHVNLCMVQRRLEALGAQLALHQRRSMNWVAPWLECVAKPLVLHPNVSSSRRVCTCVHAACRCARACTLCLNMCTWPHPCTIFPHQLPANPGVVTAKVSLCSPQLLEVALPKGGL